MILTIELDQEEDGRWIAEAINIPGALARFTIARRSARRCRKNRQEDRVTSRGPLGGG